MFEISWHNFFLLGEGDDVMNVKDLVALKLVYEERSITKASARLYVSQPSLTHRIKSLEDEFGVKILDRTPEGSFFTPQGEYILKFAEELLAKFDATKEYVRSMESTVQGTLRLGASYTFAQFELAPLLSDYKKRYPDVDISLKTELSSLILPLLQKNEVAVVITRRDLGWPEKKHLLCEEPVCIVSTQPISDNDVPNFPWITYGKDPIVEMERNNWWDERFSFPPNRIHVHNMETCLQMVLNGLGWSILPEISLRKNRSLIIRPAFRKNGEAIVRQTFLLYKDDALEWSAVKAFVNYVLDFYKEGSFTK